MATIVVSSGREFVVTSVTLPKDIKDRAKSMGIPFSATLKAGLESRIAELERAELAGNVPATSSTPTRESGGKKR